VQFDKHHSSIARLLVIDIALLSHAAFAFAFVDTPHIRFA